MKFVLLLILITITITSFTQVTITALNTKNIPEKIAYSGKPLKAATWKDDGEEHYIIATETGVWSSNNADEKTDNAALYLYHFVSTKDSIKQLWRIYDFVKECILDIDVHFYKSIFEITDLNNNGIPEVWTIYDTQCTSDVSPASRKLIMYEGLKKHALRGETRVKVSDKEYMGGGYTFDSNFTSAAPVFKNYAKTLWQKELAY